jgi:hypothetical protein
MDRSHINAALKTHLGIFAHNATHLPDFGKKYADKLGLEYFGEFERDDKTPVLRFYRHDMGEEILRNQQAKGGPEAWEVLPTIGKIRGFFAIPRQALLGIRGEHGDVLMKMNDIMVYRFNGVMEYIREQSS